jgi:HEAT repeat protein
MIRAESAVGRWPWPLLGALYSLSFSVLAVAQEPSTREGGQPDQSKSQTPAPAPKAEEPDDAPAAKDQEEEKSALEDSTFVDARAQQAMENVFDELFRTYRTGITKIEVEKMARGESRTEPAVIDRHIKAAARELTDRGNLEAVINPGAKVDNNRVKAIEAAGQAILAPLDRPIAQRDPGFEREYSAKLLEVAPQLLSNHLIARTQAMLALSRLGDKAALDLLVKQLQDDEQPIILKGLAAQGITAIASGQSLSPNEEVKASEALVALLQDPAETFWPARVRALEALGTLRQISTIAQRDEAIIAQAALQILADPSKRPEVRAWAAWAIGMMDVPASYPQINYTLLAYQYGRLAAGLGDEILIAQPERVKYLTALLCYQVFVGLEGNPTVRNSGLIKSRALGSHAPYVQQVHQLVKALASDCVQLTRAAGTHLGPAKDAVASRLAELKAYLEKNPPKDLSLVPGAPLLQVAEPVAAARGEEPNGR